MDSVIWSSPSTYLHINIVFYLEYISSLQCSAFILLHIKMLLHNVLLCVSIEKSNNNKPSFGFGEHGRRAMNMYRR